LTPTQFAQWVTTRLNHGALSAFNSDSAAYSMLVNSATLKTLAHGREWVQRTYRGYLNAWTSTADEMAPDERKDAWMTSFLSELEYSDVFFAHQPIRIFDRADLPPYVSAVLSNEPIPEDVRHPSSRLGAAPKHVLTLIAPPPDQPAEPRPVSRKIRPIPPVTRFE